MASRPDECRRGRHCGKSLPGNEDGNSGPTVIPERPSRWKFLANVANTGEMSLGLCNQSEKYPKTNQGDVASVFTDDYGVKKCEVRQRPRTADIHSKCLTLEPGDRGRLWAIVFGSF